MATSSWWELSAWAPCTTLPHTSASAECLAECQWGNSRAQEALEHSPAVPMEEQGLRMRSPDCCVCSYRLCIWIPACLGEPSIVASRWRECLHFLCLPRNWADSTISPAVSMCPGFLVSVDTKHVPGNFWNQPRFIIHSQTWQLKPRLQMHSQPSSPMWNAW